MSTTPLRIWALHSFAFVLVPVNWDIPRDLGRVIHTNCGLMGRSNTGFVCRTHFVASIRQVFCSLATTLPPRFSERKRANTYESVIAGELGTLFPEVGFQNQISFSASKEKERERKSLKDCRLARRVLSRDSSQNGVFCRVEENLDAGGWNTFSSFLSPKNFAGRLRKHLHEVSFFCVEWHSWRTIS